MFREENQYKKKVYKHTRRIQMITSVQPNAVKETEGHC